MQVVGREPEMGVSSVELEILNALSKSESEL